jgi:hypothetical protein
MEALPIVESVREIGILISQLPNHDFFRTIANDLPVSADKPDTNADIKADRAMIRYSLLLLTTSKPIFLARIWSLEKLTKKIIDPNRIKLPKKQDRKAKRRC